MGGDWLNLKHLGCVQPSQNVALGFLKWEHCAPCGVP